MKIVSSAQPNSCALTVLVSQHTENGIFERQENKKYIDALNEINIINSLGSSGALVVLKPGVTVVLTPSVAPPPGVCRTSVLLVGVLTV